MIGATGSFGTGATGSQGPTGASLEGNSTSVLFGNCQASGGVPPGSLCTPESLRRVYICLETTFVFECVGSTVTSLISSRSSLSERAAPCTDEFPCWQFSGDFTRRFMQAQDYFMWLLVVSIVLFCVVVYSVPHLLHYLLHLRRTSRKTIHNENSLQTALEPLLVPQGGGGHEVSVRLEGFGKPNSSRIRGRDRNDLVIENDRVVRRSALNNEHSGEFILEEKAGELLKQNSFLGSGAHPIVHEELEPLDPGQVALLVEAAEQQQKEKDEEAAQEEAEFGAAAQDPFASLYLSPRTALEATKTIPRSANKTRPAAEDVFDDSRPSSNEATLRMASTVGNDGFDADEAISSRHLEQAIAEAQRSLELTQKEFLESSSKVPESDNEASTDSGLSNGEDAVLPPSAPSSAKLFLDLNKVKVKPPEPIELFPSGQVMVELGNPTLLHQEELNPKTLAPLSEPVHPSVAEISTSLAPRYNSPKLQNVAAMVERYIPANAEPADEEEEEESNSFDQYPSPPRTEVFEAGLPPPPLESPRLFASAAFPPPPRGSMHFAHSPLEDVAKSDDAFPPPPRGSMHFALSPLEEVKSEVLAEAPFQPPPRNSIRASRLKDPLPDPPSSEKFEAPFQPPPRDSIRAARLEDPLPDPPRSEKFEPSPLESFVAPPETPRFAPPPETPRFEDQEEGEGEWNEPLPDPPQSGIFNLRREDWAAPPSEDESLDKSQVEDSADHPDTVTNDAHNLNPPSKGSIRGLVAELEGVNLAQSNSAKGSIRGPELDVLQPRPPLIDDLDDDVSGRRPKTLRGATELALPELEAPETFQTFARQQIE